MGFGKAGNTRLTEGLVGIRFELRLKTDLSLLSGIRFELGLKTGLRLLSNSDRALDPRLLGT